MNGKIDFWKIVSSILAATVMFLSGWVWNMEKRVTTLEVTRPYMVESINEMKSDLKEIKKFILEDNHRP